MGINHQLAALIPSSSWVSCRALEQHQSLRDRSKCCSEWHLETLTVNFSSKLWSVSKKCNERLLNESEVRLNARFGLKLRLVSTWRTQLSSVDHHSMKDSLAIRHNQLKFFNAHRRRACQWAGLVGNVRIKYPNITSSLKTLPKTLLHLLDLQMDRIVECQCLKECIHQDFLWEHFLHLRLWPDLLVTCRCNHPQDSSTLPLQIPATRYEFPGP